MLQFELETRLPGVLLASAARRLWDFEHGDTGPFFSFARSGAGTAFTAGGMIQSFASNVPRITDKGLLLEPAATNHSHYFAVTLANMGFLNNMEICDAPPNAPAPLTWIRRKAGAVQNAAYGTTSFSTGSATLVASMIIWTPDTSPPIVGTGGTTNEISIGAGPGSPIYGSEIPTVKISDHYWRCSRRVTRSGTDATWYGPSLLSSSTYDKSRDLRFSGYQLEAGDVPSSPIITNGSAVTRGAESAALTVPAGCTKWEAVYGDARTVVTGSGLAPGGTFDLVSGRPWIGLGNELKSVRFAP